MSVSNVRVIVSTSSAELYNIIRNGLNTKPNIEMIINVRSAAEAENKLSRQSMNVLIVDLDKRTESYAFLKSMTERFKLLIMLTGVTNTNAVPLMKIPIRDFIIKPLAFTGLSMQTYVGTIYNRISGFGRENSFLNAKDQQKTVDTHTKIVVIASSTGGTEALERIFRNLPQNIPPIAVVQHMTSGFTKLFANRLNTLYNMEVREACSNDYMQKGLVLIAPTDYHMKLIIQNGKLAVECFKGTKIHGVMPAADVLFESTATLMKNNAVGVVLTGMGADGAKGLMLMHKYGAATIGQNKETCVVYGMPKVAKDLGAVDYELPLDRIPGKIMELA